MFRRAHRPQPRPPPQPRSTWSKPWSRRSRAGSWINELGVLGAVINEWVRLLATARSMRTLASLRVGDRARINHNA